VGLPPGHYGQGTGDVSPARRTPPGCLSIFLARGIWFYATARIAYRFAIALGGLAAIFLLAALVTREWFLAVMAAMFAVDTVSWIWRWKHPVRP
jgi:hypothetical protein